MRLRFWDWAKNIGKDILAFFRNIFGEDILKYSEMLTKARTGRNKMKNDNLGLSIGNQSRIS